MRDPRNWARPVAAAVVGATAGAALVVLRVAQPAAAARGGRRDQRCLDLAERTLRDGRATRLRAADSRR